MVTLTPKNESMLETFETVNIGGRDIEIYHHGPLITLADAKARDEYVYFSGIPCLRNHIALRRTNNCACIVCELQKKKNKIGPVLAKMMTGQAEQEDFLKQLALVPGMNLERITADAPAAAPSTAEPTEEPAPRKPPEAFIKRDHTNSLLVKAICARIKKNYTVASMTEKATELKGEEVPPQTVRQVLAKLTKQGLIEILPTSGREFIYRTHPEYFSHFSHMKEKFCEADPEHKERIMLNYEEALKLTDKAPEEVAAIQEEDALLADIGSIEEADPMLLADAPTALIGRAIVDYIAKLRQNTEYDKYKAKVDDLRKAAHIYRTKYEDALAVTKRATVETNELKRENHDLKVRVSQLESLTAQLKGVIDRGVRGNFTLAEVAKIKGALGALGDLNVGGEHGTS